MSPFDSLPIRLSLRVPRETEGRSLRAVNSPNRMTFAATTFARRNGLFALDHRQPTQPARDSRYQIRLGLTESDGGMVCFGEAPKTISPSQPACFMKGPVLPPQLASPQPPVRGDLVTAW